MGLNELYCPLPSGLDVGFAGIGRQNADTDLNHLRIERSARCPLVATNAIVAARMAPASVKIAVRSDGGGAVDIAEGCSRGGVGGPP
jgi:hypothetical protein